MRKSNLNENEIIDMISQYQSSIKKLEFQRNNIRDAVRELQTELKELQRANLAASKAAKAEVVKPAEKSAAKKTAIANRRSKTTRLVKPVSAPETVQSESDTPTSVVEVSAPVEPVVESPAAKPTAKKMVKKRPGRPRKVKTVEKVASSSEVATAPVANDQEAPVKAPVKRRGRPSKSASAATKTPSKKAPVAKKSPAAKKTPAATKAPAKKTTSSNGKAAYRLSDWDQLVMDSLQGGLQLTRTEIEAYVAENGKALSKEMNDKQVSTKISNVLHKLTNTHGRVTKDKNEDKKTVYSLPVMEEV